MLYTLRGYKGTDPKDGGPTYIATFTNPDTGEVEWCTAYVANERTAPFFDSASVFMLMMQLGQVVGGQPSEWLARFLAQPDNKQLWESVEDGEFTVETSEAE